MYLHFDADNWKFLAIDESGNILWKSSLFPIQELKDWWSSTTFKHHNISALRLPVFEMDDGRTTWVFEDDVEGALSLVEEDVPAPVSLDLKKLWIFTIAPSEKEGN